MDPQLQSVLTSVLKDLLTGAGMTLVAKGYLTTDQESQAVVYAAGLASIALSQGLSWWKSRQASPSGLVASIGNTDPKKIAAAVDAAPPATQAVVVEVANATKVIPTTSLAAQAVQKATEQATGGKK